MPAQLSDFYTDKTKGPDVMPGPFLYLGKAARL